MEETYSSGVKHFLESYLSKYIHGTSISIFQYPWDIIISFINISSVNNLISIFQGLQACDPPCRNGGTCEENTCLCVEFGQPGDENYWKYEGNDCSIGM